MVKITNEKTKEVVRIKNSWAEISHNEFMQVWEVLPTIPEWFADSFCYKYIGAEYDFEKEITIERTNEYLETIKKLLKLFTAATVETIDTFTTKQLFEFFGYIEHFYASALLQAYFENYYSLKEGDTVEFKPTDSIKAVLVNGKYNMLNTPVQVFGAEWNQKLMTAKSQTEIMDLAGLFDKKTLPIRTEFFKMMKDRFSYLPMLAAVLTTPKYDEAKIQEKAEKYKKASMQDLISVFFYAVGLLTKYRPVTDIYTVKEETAEALPVPQ